MLKICTVYFQDYYTPDYVSKLYRSLKRYSTIPFEFICLSDTEDIEADVILPYNHHSAIKRHWHKLKFFSPHFANHQPGDEIIIMDIDQIIVNNVDKILARDVKSHGDIITYKSWWNTKYKANGQIRTEEVNKVSIPLNGGFYKFRYSHLSYIWNDFIENPTYWQNHFYESGYVHKRYYGEQNYVHWKLMEKNKRISYLPEHWIGKWTNNYEKNVELNQLYQKKFGKDYMIMNDVHRDLKIVHFNGISQNLHENTSEFVRKYWK